MTLPVPVALRVDGRRVVLIGGGPVSARRARAQMTTGDPETDAQVAADAEQRRVWCVDATDAAASSAWFPAVARSDDVTVAVSAVTAAPLEDLGVPTVQPDRARLGSMVREIAESLPGRDSRPLAVAGHRLVILATGARLDDRFLEVRPTQLAVLRALADRPGHVLSRAELAAGLPRSGDEHAVEMTVARLRSCLGVPALVQTVVKRGYRLAHDPANAN